MKETHREEVGSEAAERKVPRAEERGRAEKD